MLRLVGWLYGRIINIRNSLYDRGVFKSHSLGARTISVGNITTGGTGKTPLVARVAEILAEAGEKVCILTRGYGRANERERVLVSDGNAVLVDVREGGDEPVELGRKLLGKAIILANADRVAAAKWAKEKFGVTVFLLDDGFQHRRVKRDVDIVCDDASNISWKMLPEGRLREPIENLARADAIVVTRCDLLQGVAIHIVGLESDAPKAKIFQSRMAISRLVSLHEFLAASHEPASPGDAITYLAFCALGNPQAFFLQLRNAGFKIVPTKPFRDHHSYGQDDVNLLVDEARQLGCTAMLTTAKDAVKLMGLKFDLPCYVAEIEVVIDDPDGFRELVLFS